MQTLALIAPDVEDAGKDRVSEALFKASEDMGRAANVAVDAAKGAGTVAAEGMQKVGAAASGTVKIAGDTASQATQTVSDFLGSLRKKS